MNASTTQVNALNGEQFQLSAALWQKNQQQREILLRYLCLPLQETEDCLWLGVDSLANITAHDTFAFLSGKSVEPVLLASQELKKGLQALAPQSNKVEENPVFYTALSAHNEPATTEQTDEPVIQLLNQLFENAMQQQASDIHLEPQAQSLQIRFRIDGVLQAQPPISLNLSNRIISRLKLLAKLDISETRLPQDGRFHFKTTFSDVLDFRLSTLPTHWGEKAVLRLQQNKPVQLSFAELGMTEKQQAIFRQALSQPQGLILATGPTGSGKSITLYTALQFLNRPEKHIMTAEDPIEIELSGIIQSQIHPQIGLDFSRLLRTFLRQDPDVIMLGEIRDQETAQMALRAAQTGHLVLSTLHTNDAASAISRLTQLGIQQHEIHNSLLLVIAQRLLRKGCSKCGQNPPRFVDCDCHQGYKGRTGIYQFLQPHFVRDQWQYSLDYAELRQAAQEKIRLNITDQAEVDRVLGTAMEKQP